MRERAPWPGVTYHAFVATAPTGEIALAIGHTEPDGSCVVDAVKETVVSGGDAGIDEVYRGLRARGFVVNDFRRQADWDGTRPDPGAVRDRAVAGLRAVCASNGAM